MADILDSFARNRRRLPTVRSKDPLDQMVEPSKRWLPSVNSSDPVNQIVESAQRYSVPKLKENARILAAGYADLPETQANPFGMLYGGFRAAGQGIIGESAAGALSTIVAPFSESGAEWIDDWRDESSRETDAIADAYAQNVDKSNWDSFSKRVLKGVPGVGASIGQAAIYAKGGPIGIMAGYGYSAYASSKRDALDLGLGVKEAEEYGMKQGASEAGVMMAFQQLGKLVPGLAGIEGVALKQEIPKMLTREWAKRGLVMTAGEITEEEITMIIQSVVEASTLPGHEHVANWTNEDGTMWGSPMVERMLDTGLQAAMGVQANLAISGVQRQLKTTDDAVADFIKVPSRRKYDRLPEELRPQPKMETAERKKYAAELEAERKKYEAELESAKTLAEANIPGAIPDLTQGVELNVAPDDAASEPLGPPLEAQPPAKTSIGEQLKDLSDEELDELNVDVVDFDPEERAAIKEEVTTRTADPLPEIKVTPRKPKKKKSVGDALRSIVLEQGGIDPKTVRKEFSWENDVVGNGLVGMMRKGGQQLDLLAERMVRDGQMTVPADRNASDYLIEQLRENAQSNLKNYDAEFDAEAKRIQKDIDDASQYLSKDEIAFIVQRAEEDAADEAKAAERADSSDGSVDPVIAAQTQATDLATYNEEKFELKSEPAEKPLARPNESMVQPDLFGEAKTTVSPADGGVPQQSESLEGQKTLFNEDKNPNETVSLERPTRQEVYSSPESFDKARDEFQATIARKGVADAPNGDTIKIIPDSVTDGRYVLEVVTPEGSRSVVGDTAASIERAQEQALKLAFDSTRSTAALPEPSSPSAPATEGYQALPEKIRTLFESALDAKDGVKLSEWLASGNKTLQLGGRRRDRFRLRAEFTARTGVKLPRGVQASKDAITKYVSIPPRTQSNAAKVLSQAEKMREAETLIKIAADNVSKLRKGDVYRVLDNARDEFRGYMEEFIKTNRPDLSDEVDAAVSDLNAESAATKDATVSPKLSATEFKKRLQSSFGEAEGDAQYQLVEARAKAAGETVDEYVGRRVADVRSSDVSQVGKDALHQTPRDAEYTPDALQLGPLWHMKSRQIVQDKMGNKASPQQVLAMLKKNGVKAEELEWMGLEELLGGTTTAKTVTKEQVLQAIDTGLQIEEVVKGGKSSLDPDDVREQVVNDVREVLGRQNALTEEVEDAASDFYLNGDDIGAYDTLDDALIAAGEPRMQAMWDQAENQLPAIQGGGTRYGDSDYVLPGGTDQVEIVMYSPSIEQYSGEDDQHFGDVTDRRGVAWLRGNTRIDADGKKVFFVEEVQAKRHQEGRKKGYVKSSKLPDKSKWTAEKTGEVGRGVIEGVPEWIVFDENDDHVATHVYANSESQAIAKAAEGRAAMQNDLDNREAVPDAPFKKTWPMLGMKRAIQYAAENGFDRVAWTTGEQQADRYDLSEQVDEISYQPDEAGEDGEFYIAVRNAPIHGTVDSKGIVVESNDNMIKGKPLEDVVGKEIADRLLNGTPDNQGFVRLKDNDLKIGGEGMKAFYDKMLPNKVNKFVKKFGAKVGTTDIGTKAVVHSRGGNEYEYDTMEEAEVNNAGAGGRISRKEDNVHSFDITPKMRDSALKHGQPLFQKPKGGEAQGAIEFQGDGRAIIHAFESKDASTGLHELFHLFRRDLAGEDKSITEEWAGVKDGNWTQEAEEKFARGGEKYLRTGKAPIPKLKEIFKKFKSWLEDVYKTLRGSSIDVKISKEMTDVFDRMFTPVEDEGRGPTDEELDAAIDAELDRLEKEEAEAASKKAKAPKAKSTRASKPRKPRSKTGQKTAAAVEKSNKEVKDLLAKFKSRMDARGFIADEDGSIDPEALSDTIALVRGLAKNGTLRFADAVVVVAETMGNAWAKKYGQYLERAWNRVAARDPDLEPNTSKVEDVLNANVGTGEARGAGRPTEAGESPADRGGEGQGYAGRTPSSIGSSVGKNQEEGSDPASGRKDDGKDEGNGSDTPGGDVRLDANVIGSGGIRTKYGRNVSAITLLKEIEKEGRLATSDEQAVLAQYVGWGMFPGVFNDLNDKAFKNMSAEQRAEQNPNKWQKQKEEIQELLSEEEWKSAAASTINAHFTSPKVVQGMWDIVGRLGFEGGSVLEPASGTGNFIGFQPESMKQKSDWTAVEMDSLTGRMARQLYQSANTHIQPYEDFVVPNDTYDLAISNVPFADVTIKSDPKYKSKSPNLHDYFFLKTIDKVRPGGLVVFITSTGTMDKASPLVRRALADKADLVSAFRLPGTAFKENAGTEVVTDMIILKKRGVNDKPSGESWTKLGSLPDPVSEYKISHPDYGKAIPVNEYFAKNKKNILGRLDRNSKLYGPGKPNVTGTKDFPALWEKAQESVPESVYVKGEARSDAPRLTEQGKEREGTSIVKDGELYNVSQGALVLVRRPIHNPRLEVAKTKADAVFAQAKKEADAAKPGSPEARKADKRLEIAKDKRQAARNDVSAATRKKNAYERSFAQMRDIAPVRTAIIDRINGMMSPKTTKAQKDQQRKQLGKAYKAFVAAHGPINATKTFTKKKQSSGAVARTLKDDVDWPLLASLEVWDKEKNKVIQLNDIFDRDSVVLPAPVEKSDSLLDAVAVSQNETGGIDVNRIAKLLSKSVPEVEEEFKASGRAFYDPASGWVPKDEYLSGNVRVKLRQAKERAKTDPSMDQNVEALEKSMPEDITSDAISVRPGAQWVPTEVTADFVSEILGTKASDLDIKFMEYNGETLVRPKSTVDMGSTTINQIWGTRYANFFRLWKVAATGVPIVVRTKDANGDLRVDSEETNAANDKAGEIREEFEEWLFSDSERREKLTKTYNEVVNANIERKYDGSHQQLPGMLAVGSMLASEGRVFEGLRPHQQNAVWMAVNRGRALFAHEVGTGKTMTMAASAMELKRLGLAKKPAIIVPNSRVEATLREIQDLYPAARVMAASRGMTEKSRKQTVARMATGDWDIVVLTHNNLMNVPVGSSVQTQYYEEEAEALRAVIVEEGEDPDGDYKVQRNFAVKQLQKRMQSLKQNIKELASGRDDGVTFEQTGIDTVFVDEAHEFKSMPIITKLGPIKGVPGGDSAQKAANLDMITRYIKSRMNGRGVFLATGTPVTNSMAEMYVMQKYVQDDLLDQAGVKTFDAWANTFGRSVTRIEYSHAGGHKVSTRFSEFVNLPELRALAFQDIDHVRAEDDPVLSKLLKRPKRIDKEIVVPKSEFQSQYLKELNFRANNLDPKGTDNHLNILGDGTRASLDVRLVTNSPNAEDLATNKITALVGEVNRVITEKPGTTQLIFAEAYQSTATGFDVGKEVIDKLVESGFDPKEIADFRGSKTEKVKDEMITKLRKGIFKIAIGNTKTLGQGVNAQDLISAVHHLQAPHTPEAIEQRNGRAYRQGNTNGEVEILTYLAAGTLDTWKYQNVSRKDKFIKQLFAGNNEQREMFDDDDQEAVMADFDRMMALSSGNPLLIKHLNYKNDVQNLESGKARFQRTQDRLVKDREENEVKIEITERAAKRLDVEAQEWIEYQAGKPEWSVEIDGTPYTDRNAASSAMRVGTKGSIGPISFEITVDRDTAWVSYGGRDGAHKRFPQPEHARHDYAFDEAGETRSGGHEQARLDDVNKIFTNIATYGSRLGHHAKMKRDRIPQLEADIAAIDKSLKRPWKNEQRYQEKQEKLAEVVAELERTGDLPVEEDAPRKAERAFPADQNSWWDTDATAEERDALLTQAGFKKKQAKRSAYMSEYTPEIQEALKGLIQTKPLKGLIQTKPWMSDAVSEIKAYPASSSMPLSDLRSKHPEMSRGQFQDGIRTLAEQGAIELHPWTGTMNDLDDSAALIQGQEIKQYASVKNPSAAVEVPFRDNQQWKQSLDVSSDTTLPELYKQSGAPSIGAFHDEVTRLAATGEIILQPFRDPMYKLGGTVEPLVLDGEIRFNVSPGRKAERGYPANAPQPGGLKAVLETEETVSAQSIRATIQKDFGLPIRPGRVPKFLAAVYKAFPEVVRALKHRLGEVGLIAHELGHHVDEKTDILKDLSAKERQELKTMDLHSTKSLVDEGFSEYMRYWLQNPGAAASIAPEFTKKWNAWLKDKTNDWGPKLNNLQVLTQRLTNMTALQRAQSLIKADGTPDKPADQTILDSYSTLTAKYGRWKDDLHDFKILDRRSRKLKYKLGDKESWSYDVAAAMHNTHVAASQRAFQYGVHRVDQEGDYNVIGDSLMMKMDDLGIKGTEELSRAESYMLAAFTLYMDEYLPPIVKYVDAQGKRVEKGSEGAKRIEERYNTSLSVADATEIVNGTKEEDAARYKEFHKALTEFNNDGLRMLHHAGLISEEDLGLLLKNKMYIPLIRVPDGSKAASIVGKGDLLDVRSPLRRRSKLGSGAPIMSPILATVQRMGQFYQRAHDQQIKAQVLRQTKGTKGIGGLMEIVTPNMKMTKLKLSDAMSQIQGTLEGAGLDPEAFSELDQQKLSDAFIKIYRSDMSPNEFEMVDRIIDDDGKSVLVKMDPSFHKMLSESSPFLQHWMTQAIGGITNTMKVGAVGINTGFAIPNMVMDLIAFNQNSKHTKGLKIFEPLGWMGRYFIDTFKRKSDNEVIQMYQEMTGAMASRFGDRDTRSTDIRDRLIQKRSYSPRRMVDWVQEKVGVSDVGPRITEFVGALKDAGFILKGNKIWDTAKKEYARPPRAVLIEAINAANDVTLNFRRKGHAIRAIDQFIPFFGAAVEGFDKTYIRVYGKGLLFGDKTEGNRARIFTSLVGLAALEALHWSFRHLDDDYEEQEDWMNNSWTFTNGQGDPWLAIPKSREAAFVANLTSGILNSLTGQQKNGIKDALYRQFWLSAPPLEPLIPATVAEVIGNYNFFREGPLEPRGMESRKPMDRKQPWTTPFAAWLGKYTNSMRLSPIKIDHIMDRFSGGMIPKISGLMVESGRAVRGEENRLADVALKTAVGRAYVRAHYPSSTNDFYDAAQETHEEIGSLRHNAELEQQELILQINKLKGTKAGVPDELKQKLAATLNRAVPRELKERQYKYDKVKDFAAALRLGLTNVRGRVARENVQMFITGMSRWAMNRDDRKKYPNPFKLGNIPEDSKIRIKEELTKIIVQAVRTPLPNVPYDDSPYHRSVNHARMFLKESGLTFDQAERLLKDELRVSTLSKVASTRVKQKKTRAAKLQALERIMK